MQEDQIKQRMQSAVDNLKQDIGSIRTGRATPSLIENIVVDAYGGTSKLRIQELASISVPDPQSLVITPWDKTVIPEIKKGIELANIGLNPMIQADFIRIALSPMTQEDREKYVKLLHQKLENGRIQLRQVRQDAMQEVKKKFEAKEIGEDEKDRLEKRIQDLTDQHILQLEQVGQVKEAELRSV